MGPRVTCRQGCSIAASLLIAAVSTPLPRAHAASIVVGEEAEKTIPSQKDVRVLGTGNSARLGSANSPDGHSTPGVDWERHWDLKEQHSVVSFKSSNEYDDVTWSPWAHIAEPYRETVLRADSTVGHPDEDVFIWTFPGEHEASYEGR